jgi:hypothetical protein
MAGEISAKDSGVYREYWPMTIFATKSPMIRRKPPLAHFALIGSRDPTNKPSWHRWEPGRIDQALLAILPARHQALRLWGLADKVLDSEPT